MKDEADRIIDELLAREGAMTREQLEQAASKAVRAQGENPNTRLGRQFLKHTMIAIAAKDDAEADALLARAQAAGIGEEATLH